MASYHDDSPLEFCLGHKREQSQDSGAYIDWNSEDSASPVNNPDNNGNEDFITVVSVENGESEVKKDVASSFVTILAIGESEDEDQKTTQNEEEVLLYRLPGERLGFGLKFEGGTNTAENVKRLFIQSSAPDSPASRAKCSWGSLVEGDEILKIDGHVVKDMTRLDCVRCLKESSVVIKLYIKHKGQKLNQQQLRNKQENPTEIHVNNSFSSPTIVSAEMKKSIPPPPPVPPRKISRKSLLSASKEEPIVFSPPDGFGDQQNQNIPMPKVRNIQVVADETSRNLSKFIIRVPQKGSHDSPDLAKRIVKKTCLDLKLIPPEPKVYLDVLAQEDSRNCESESDDTGSTISTVVGLSFSNTTNSSFSDLRSSASSFCDSTNPSTPTSEPSTPVFDLSRMLTPYEPTDNNEFLFTKLINGKDQDNISCAEEKMFNCADDMAPLQPPLSFQDAPLSYGNEEMRANLTENLEFNDDIFSKNHQEEVVFEIEAPSEGRVKENNSKLTILSKKPSLIPRLAKTIGLLSPPKPSPRKESITDGNKSRFSKKKPPPLPPSGDSIQNSQAESVEGKTLKSSIPYLKKKKIKNDDSKKNYKIDKKLKLSTSIDEINKRKQTPLLNETENNPEVEETKKESELPKTPENDRKLSWEVPDLKNSKRNSNLESANETEKMECSDGPILEPKGFVLGLENSDFKVDVEKECEPHFLFPWVASKQLETIGEDEEDLSTEETFERYVSSDKKKEGKSLMHIVEKMVTIEDGVADENLEAVQKNKEVGNDSLKTKGEEEKKEQKENSKKTEDTDRDEQLDDSNQENKWRVGDEKVKDKTDESEANGPKYKSALCNNHVLLKLDNDSLEVVKNVGLNTSNGEIKDVMVPVVSTAIGLTATSSFNRMPPDGHEFPTDFSEQSLSSESMNAKIQERPQLKCVEVVLPPLPTSEPPLTPLGKCSLLFDRERDVLLDKKCFTERLNRESTAGKRCGRNSFWRQDEKSEKSVRDKIAMFSSVPNSNECPGKLSKYKSSDDVFYCDETDGNRNFRNGKFFSQSIMSLDKVSNDVNPFVKKSSFGTTATQPRSLDYTNRTQSSMDLSSSSSAYSSSCSPDSSLSSNSSYLGYSSTLPRKKTTEETDSNKKDNGIHRTTSFNIHGRSQSLLDVNPSLYKTRYLSESSQDDSSKAGSLNMLIEQRRKNLSKLRGLVIPEKLSDAVPSEPIVDLPEIKSRDLILNSKVPSAYKEKPKSSKWGQATIRESNPAPKLNPTHLWDQSKTPNIPKYSPAFKRKSISVFGSKEPMSSKKEIQDSFQESLKPPVKPPRNIIASCSNSEDRKYQDGVSSSDGETYIFEKSHRFGESPRLIDVFVPKRKSTPQGKYRLHGDSGRLEEDSDNDSAVSSSRSSISHGFSPPASPLLDGQYQGTDDSSHKLSLMLSSPESPLIRTVSSDAAASNTIGSQPGSNDSSYSDTNNKRILKPQSVEARNRKNVLASAKYSRGFDEKSGSPLIQRKFLGETSNIKEPDSSEVFSVSDNLYLEKEYSAASDFPAMQSETAGRSQIEKTAYVTDVENLTVSGKKKLEKSESLPTEPTAVQPPALRKTSVPFAYSWENGNNWDQSNKKQVEVLKNNHVPIHSRNSLDTSKKASSIDKAPTKFLASDKYLEFCARIKNEKSSVETDPSLSSINSSNESATAKTKNINLEFKGAQINIEKTTFGSHHSISVNDIRKTFEKTEGSIPSLSRLGNGKIGNSNAGYSSVSGNHVRVSSLDSTNSEDNCGSVQLPYGFSYNLQKEQFGSITSLASSTSLISPQELQLLIEEANQTLEESGTNAGGSSSNNHDVLVIILHRDTVGGSVGITLAGGADYESKEITVHKVLAGSPADRDGRIQKGDRILSINGKSMKGVTHRESLTILKSPRLEVVLVVSRLKSDSNSESMNADDTTLTAVRHTILPVSSRPPRILEGTALGETNASLGEIHWGPAVTLNLIKDGAGLGFSLEGGKDCPTGDRPLVVKKIFTGGAAEKCGQLKAGDELVNVNGIDVSVMSRIEAWKLMKQLPDGNVTITVKHQLESKLVAPA